MSEEKETQQLDEASQIRVNAINFCLNKISNMLRTADKLASNGYDQEQILTLLGIGAEEFVFNQYVFNTIVANLKEQQTKVEETKE